MPMKCRIRSYAGCREWNNEAIDRVVVDKPGGGDFLVGWGPTTFPRAAMGQPDRL